MKQHVLFFLATIVFLLFSCSPRLTPFTQRMYDDFGWTEKELQEIQFYLSHDIILTKDQGASNTRIEDGKIKIKDGRNIAEVVFKKGTPGVLIFTPKSNRFAVSFESGDRYLMFGPNKNAGGRYVLLAKDWKRRFGKVSYDGEIYSTSSESAFASLMVDIKKAERVKYNSEEVSGRKVN